MKVIDRFEDKLVSAFVTPSGQYFLLLHHSNRSEESIRNFFVEIHEIYVKHLLNPFYVPDSPVLSMHFDLHVRALSKRYLHL